MYDWVGAQLLMIFPVILFNIAFVFSTFMLILREIYKHQLNAVQSVSVEGLTSEDVREHFRSQGYAPLLPIRRAAACSCVRR